MYSDFGEKLKPISNISSKDHGLSAKEEREMIQMIADEIDDTDSKEEYLKLVVTSQSLDLFQT